MLKDRSNPKIFNKIELNEEIADYFLTKIQVNITTTSPHYLEMKGTNNIKSIHPIFYGCYDWHSSVHSYWSMLKLMKLFPSLSGKYKEYFKIVFTKDNITTEIDTIDTYINEEMPYGCSWLLYLASELYLWGEVENDTFAKEVYQIILPLEQYMVTNVFSYLVDLNQAYYLGLHENTSFSFWLILEYSKITKYQALEEFVIQKSLDLFDNYKVVKDPETNYEFLSPNLSIVHLLSKVKSEDQFRLFIEKLQLREFVTCLKPAKGDTHKPAESHLVGLTFCRCWCLGTIMNFITDKNLKDELNSLYLDHFNESYKEIANSGWMGGHWIITFCLLALLNYKSDKI